MRTAASARASTRDLATHLTRWPPVLPQHLTIPGTNLFHNAEVSAARYRDKPFIVFYDRPITFREFRIEDERTADYLQHERGLKAGDRVRLCRQDSPQWFSGSAASCARTGLSCR